MFPPSHPYVRGDNGRVIKPSRGGVLATLTCTLCRDKESIRFRKICDAGQIDQKFEQRGWNVKKMAHGSCIKEDKDMGNTPSGNAVRAQIKMLGLLETHFDKAKGCYGKGWSDKKIAEDCGLSEDVVTAFRREGFGELKESPEVLALAGDIAALEQLLTETMATFSRDIAGMKVRLADLRRTAT